MNSNQDCSFLDSNVDFQIRAEQSYVINDSDFFCSQIVMARN